MIAFVLLLATTVAAQEGTISGTVYQTTNVRGGPDTRFAIVGQLSADDQVEIDGRDEEGRWLHVVLADGTKGWLPVFALIIDDDLTNVPVVPEDAGTPEASSSISVISYGRVNVRSGPGIAYDIVAQLDVDDQAAALARSSGENDWLLIRFGDTEGWVAYFTVNVQGDARTLPVLVPDSSGQSLIPPSRLLRARFNVRLHEAPTLSSDVVAIVPFDSEVTPIARSADGNWLFVGFNDQSGWSVTQLLDVSSEEVQALPIRVQRSTASATPEATT
ncbi:MAG: SH3 domain-containing protein, partial [Chloroflexota bacterium]